MKALLVVNPEAGPVWMPARVLRLEQLLAGVGFEVLRLPVESAGSVCDAITAALGSHSPEDTRVVVAGGDGSIRATVPALMDTPYTLAILPVGSVNVLARELGIPLAPAMAARVAMEGQPRVLDVGRANGQAFTLMAGMGFDAAVVHAVTRPAKRLFGSLAYISRAVGLAFRYGPSQCHLTVDGAVEDREVWLAVVTNIPRYAYRWQVSPGARLDDGILDLAMFEASSVSLGVKQALAVLRGDPDYEGITRRRGRTFRFEFDPPIQLQLDGDPAGATPVDIDVVPGALSVMVP